MPLPATYSRDFILASLPQSLSLVESLINLESTFRNPLQVAQQHIDNLGSMWFPEVSPREFADDLEDECNALAHEWLWAMRRNVAGLPMVQSAIEALYDACTDWRDFARDPAEAIDAEYNTQRATQWFNESL